MGLRKYLPIVLILLSFAVSVLYYPALPDPMPSHWNARGEVDRYMPKDTAIFLIPILLVGIYVLLRLVPKIDPLKKNIEKFLDEYEKFILVMIAFMVLLHIGMIFWSLGYHISFNLIILPLMAVLFYFVADLLEKAKRNFFIGIRTPWTLVSDEVWEKTHKLGAKMFRGFAVLTLIFLLAPEKIIWWVVLMIAGIIYLVYYSYQLYSELPARKRKKTFKL